MTRVVLALVSLALAAGLLVFAVPALEGVRWSDVAGVLTAVPTATLLALTVLWLAGQWAYTYVLTGSLPGLRPGQAFLVTAAGSAISNLLPFGGAAGVGLTVAMTRTWGHTPAAIATSTLVSGIWNAAFRVALPLVALAFGSAAVLTDSTIPLLATTATVLLLAPLASPRRAAKLLGRKPLRFLLRVKTSTRTVVRSNWPRMTMGMLAYLTLQALLFWLCLEVSGASPPWPTTLAAFATSRLLTLAVVSPGGVGITENGTIALLLTLNTPPTQAVAGVLLFSTFTYAAEIPLGALSYLLWTHQSRQPGRPKTPTPHLTHSQP